MAPPSTWCWIDDDLERVVLDWHEERLPASFACSQISSTESNATELEDPIERNLVARVGCAHRRPNSEGCLPCRFQRKVHGKPRPSRCRLFFHHGTGNCPPLPVADRTLLGPEDRMLTLSRRRSNRLGGRFSLMRWPRVVSP